MRYMNTKEWFNTLGSFYLPREYKNHLISEKCLDYDDLPEKFNYKLLSKEERNMMNAKNMDVRVVVENKVVEVTFIDGDKQKAICQEPDTFSLEMAISICITKHLLGGTKEYNKAIRNGLKCYENKLKKEDAEAKEKEKIEKRRAKLAAYKKRKAERRKEEQIETQKEAYLRAMRDCNKELSEASCE